MAYNRDAAVTYARLFSQVPCSDGFIMLNGRGGLPDYIATPDGTTIVSDFDADGNIVSERVLAADGSPFTLPNSDALTNAQADDCTHFISSCIGQPPKVAAGGLKLPRMWGDPPHDPYGVSRVSTLLKYLTDHGLARALATNSTDTTVADRLDPGDLIAYVNSDGEAQHFGLYVGSGLICSHTRSRLDWPWQRLDFSAWTFLHIA
ncbi:MAG TPA: amidase domain-containing protein [Polyangia bacterium]|nr:amidase domain-containing protein [Polyangia bacterium]